MTATPPPPAAPDLEEGRRLWDRLQATLAAKEEAMKRTPTRVTREDLDHIDASDAFRKYVAANFPALLSRLSAAEQEAERLRRENERYRRAIWSAVRTAGRIHGQRRHVWWSAVGWLFGLGSTSSHALCLEFGVDPNSVGQPRELENARAALSAEAR